MAYAIIGAICMAIGFTIGRFERRKPSQGVIFMDTSTGDPLLFLELHAPIESVMASETALFEVIADQSRENN